jgi:hypothetical protein
MISWLGSQNVIRGRDQIYDRRTKSAIWHGFVEEEYAARLCLYKAIAAVSPVINVAGIASLHSAWSW